MYNPFLIFLRPFALLNRTIVQCRNMLFDRGLFKPWQSSIPVVSVGNLSAGGTGKTPLADWITKYYLSIGCKPAIVSRGYLRKSKGVQLVSDGHRILLNSNESGDEIAMLAWNNPDAIVVVAKKRKDAVTYIDNQFAKRLPSVIILDDAFQHRQIDRQLDIAIINAAEPFLKAKMLPEGRLREPRKNLSRASLIVLNKIADNEKADAIIKELQKNSRPIIKARLKLGELVCFSGESYLPDDLSASSQHINALAFAGIASPSSFVESLTNKGINVVAHRFFHDHEPYSIKKLLSIRREAEKKELSLITTEKDYFRILGNPECIRILATMPSYYLKVETDIFEGEDILKSMLNTIVEK